MTYYVVAMTATMAEKIKISLDMTQAMADDLDELVADSDHFVNRSEAVRYSIREMLQRTAVDDE